MNLLGDSLSVENNHDQASISNIALYLERPTYKKKAKENKQSNNNNKKSKKKQKQKNQKKKQSKKKQKTKQPGINSLSIHKPEGAYGHSYIETSIINVK